MNTIDWCKKQKTGIRIIELNDNLSKSYIDDSDDSLASVEGVVGKWKVVIAYYSCYNALYSICMKCGIKSEIHDCTINLMSFFGFNEKDIEFMKVLKKKRIGSQYYLEKNEINIVEIKQFVLKCKNILENIDVEDVRTEVSK